MFKLIYRSAIVTVLLAVVLSGVYPLAVYIVARVAFPAGSTGDIVMKDGKAVGAKLIGQNFTRPEYFHGRPSAAGQNGYDPTSSGGTNLGPTSQKLLKAVDDNVKRVLTENPGLSAGQVPVDLVTASGSGLDPHISPEAAYVQVARVAAARKWDVKKVKALVSSHTEHRQLGFLGEPVVNVLLLNLALDEQPGT
jgi:potassium-transporting ATPase KdpC subunit